MERSMQETKAVGTTRFVEAVSLGVLCALIFVWPIGHTVALRNILIGTDVVLFGWMVWRNGSGTWSPELTRVSCLLALFTLWAVVVALFFAIDRALTLKEIRGQWLMSLVVFGLGILAASASRGGSLLTAGSLLGALWLATMAHVVAVDAQGVREWILTRHVPHRLSGLTPGAPSASCLVAPFACLMMTDVFCRATLRNRLFPIPGIVLAAGILATMFAMYFVGVRNGTISFLVVVAILSALYCAVSRGKLRGWMIAFNMTAVLIVAGGIAYISYRKDARWQKFFGTLPLAWDTVHHKAWLDSQTYPCPLLPDGQPVDQSTYERVAWIKEGVLSVRDHPLGVGFGRHVFGTAITQKYGKNACGESHSGIVDIAIGTGLPGLFVWLAFLGYAVRVGWREYRAHQSAFGMGLTVLVAAFSLRLVVDGIQRDHMLQQLMFQTGLLLVLSSSRESRIAEGKECRSAPPE